MYVSNLEAITDAPDRDDMPTDVAQLLAQAEDVAVDSSVKDLELVAPQALNQVGAAKRPARVADEQGEQIEFSAGQIDRLAVDVDRSAGHVDSYVFFSSRRRHTRYWRDWSSDVCSSD